MKLSKEELDEIEQQLSCPSGENGIEAGNRMHESNLSMTLASIEALNLTSGEHILEIGHGNCSHLSDVLSRADNLCYTGIEISEVMHSEAQRINSDLDAEFVLYDGNHLPFEDNQFHKIFSVNTIYFWENPTNFILEIERVLTSNGRAILAFADKRFMENLPFVNSKFTLYGEEEFRAIVEGTSFQIEGISTHSEQVESKAGDSVKRNYFVASLKK